MYKGILLYTSAFFFSAVLAALAKLITSNYGEPTILFYQFLFSLLIITPYFFKHPKLLKTKDWKFIILRSSLGICGFIFLYYAIHSITLVNAVVLNSLSPLFVPLLILIFFGRSSSLYLWLCLLVGFLGVLLVLNPSASNFIHLNGAAAGIISGLCAGAFFVVSDHIRKNNHPLALSFYYFLQGFLIFAFYLMITGTLEAISLKTGLIILAMSTVICAIQYLLQKAYSFASARRLAPFNNFYIVFSFIFGWYFWSEIPSFQAACGIVLIMLGAMLSIILRNQTARESEHI